MDIVARTRNQESIFQLFSPQTMVGRAGLEPATYGLKEHSSNRHLTTRNTVVSCVRDFAQIPPATHEIEISMICGGW